MTLKKLMMLIGSGAFGMACLGCDSSAGGLSIIPWDLWGLAPNGLWNTILTATGLGDIIGMLPTL